MQYLALFVMMAMIHTSSSEIHCWPDNRWSLEYSRSGGVHCGEKHYMRGFIGRGSAVWGPSNSPIKYTKCCGAPTPIANQSTTQRCEFADWNSTLGSYDKWVLCPMGHFLEGFDRTGFGFLSFREGRCCKPENLPNSYLECKIKDVDTSFETRSWGECDPGYYLVGLFKGDCNMIQCLDKIKCCSMNCSSNFCKNGATCQNSNGTYSCDCKLGYTGSRCETDINDCSPNPCQHGGTCVDLVGTYRCGCKPGYTGKNCANDINECSSNPCKNNGTCIDLVGEFKCYCMPGFNGSACETDNRNCSMKPCKNRGTCVDHANGHRCYCRLGFTGSQCETEINECASNPCKNGATCVDLISGYRCNCTAGYTGRSCENEIITCESDPCLNGSTCVDHTEGYRCECVDGFIGVKCEFLADHHCEE